MSLWCICRPQGHQAKLPDARTRLLARGAALWGPHVPPSTCLDDRVASFLCFRLSHDCRDGCSAGARRDCRRTQHRVPCIRGRHRVARGRRADQVHVTQGVHSLPAGLGALVLLCCWHARCPMYSLRRRGVLSCLQLHTQALLCRAAPTLHASRYHCHRRLIIFQICSLCFLWTLHCMNARDTHAHAHLPRPARRCFAPCVARHQSCIFCVCHAYSP